MLQHLTSYQGLLDQREQINQQIEQAKETELQAVIIDIRQKITEYGLTALDVGFLSVPPEKFEKIRKKRIYGRVPPKYYDPDSGKVWSGRGKPPAWILGKNREAFLINP